LGHVHLDHVVVNLAYTFDLADVVLYIRTFTLCPLVAEDDVICRKGRTVMKLHALAQFKAPDQGRGLFPAGGQPRSELEVLAARDQRLIHIAGHGQLQGLLQRMRVHRQRIALVGDSQSHRTRY
jgi:hypothetical protein